MADPVPGPHDVAVSPDPGGTRLVLSETTGAALLHLAGPREGAALDAVLRELQLDSLPGPNRSGGRAGLHMLSIGPGTWWHLAEPSGGASDEVGRAFEAAVDIGDAWSRVTMEGLCARDLLSKGSALDVHPRRFPPGACTATAFAQLRAVVWRPTEAPRFDLFVGRSYVGGLWDWLSHAAREFGWTDSAPAGSSRIVPPRLPDRSPGSPVGLDPPS